MKRLVDLVDRGPEDDYFFPSSAAETLFRSSWPVAHNAVPEIVEVAYEGAAGWGRRITVPLRARETGDLLSWLCVRIRPRSWLGADLESRVLAGTWDYADPSGAWEWAGSLATAAIARVEWEIGDTTIESWGGEWMDVWSRLRLDGGRAATWDADIYGQRRVVALRGGDGADAAATVLPTEDGSIYCWLPLSFLRRPRTAFPLVALGEHSQMRVHITFRPFADVVRRRARVRATPDEVPLGETLTMLDITGPTPVPWQVRLGAAVPEFDDATVLAGVVQLEDPLRGAYMREPLEMLYEPVRHMIYDVADKLAVRTLEARTAGAQPNTVTMQLRLTELNGPIREIAFFVRRKGIWGYNEWTNYGALLEDALAATAADREDSVVRQTPLLSRARLWVENAVWREESEQWWRAEYALEHRGGVRAAGGMIYGFVLGDAARWTVDDMQPVGTVNASRAEIRLELEVIPPLPTPAEMEDCAGGRSGWEVHVFGVGLNWIRFVGGVVGPLFQD
jgi:hypothetical protein